MSGGSRDYFYQKLKEQANIKDAEDVNRLIRALAGFMEDVELYESSDIGKETYNKALKKFRSEWLGSDTSRKSGYIRGLQKARQLINEEMAREF